MSSVNCSYQEQMCNSQKEPWATLLTDLDALRTPAIGN